jgi:hypothetical protein
VVTVAVVQEALQRIVPNNEAQRGDNRCVILSELEFRKFLHVGNGNPERTAQRILTYWTERKRIFGNSGGNHSPLEPSSLALSNTQPLDQGFLSIITTSDNHNKNKQQTMTVLFLDERQMKNNTPMDAHDDNHNNRFFQSVQQCVFYVLANAAAAWNVTLIVYYEHIVTFDFRIVKEIIRLATQVIPIPHFTFHIACLSQYTSIVNTVIPSLLRYIGGGQKQQFFPNLIPQVHIGDDPCDLLRQITTTTSVVVGENKKEPTPVLTPELLPECLGGTWNHANFVQWWKDHTSTTTNRPDDVKLFLVGQPTVPKKSSKDSPSSTTTIATTSMLESSFRPLIPTEKRMSGRGSSYSSSSSSKDGSSCKRRSTTTTGSLDRKPPAEAAATTATIFQTTTTITSSSESHPLETLRPNQNTGVKEEEEQVVKNSDNNSNNNNTGGVVAVVDLTEIEDEPENDTIPDQRQQSWVHESQDHHHHHQIDYNQEEEVQRLIMVRKRNAIYSKRKYYKKKAEVERLEQEKFKLKVENHRLKNDNDRLESMLRKAQELVTVSKLFMSSSAFACNNNAARIQPEMMTTTTTTTTASTTISSPSFSNPNVLYDFLRQQQEQGSSSSSRERDIRNQQQLLLHDNISNTMSSSAQVMEQQLLGQITRLSSMSSAAAAASMYNGPSNTTTNTNTVPGLYSYIDLADASGITPWLLMQQQQQQHTQQQRQPSSSSLTSAASSRQQLPLDAPMSLLLGRTTTTASPDSQLSSPPTTIEALLRGERSLNAQASSSSLTTGSLQALLSSSNDSINQGSIPAQQSSQRSKAYNPALLDFLRRSRFEKDFK